VAAAATMTGAAARNRDTFKRAYYARRGLGGGYELLPVSVESFGWMGAPAYALLGLVADVAANGGGVSKAAFMKIALQEMGVTLAKGNGRVLRAHLSLVAQASGRAYLPGLPVLVAEVVDLAGWSGIGWLYIVSSVRSSLVLSFFSWAYVRAFLAWHVAVVSAFMAVVLCRLVS
jgi:hypothetical protein